MEASARTSLVVTSHLLEQPSARLAEYAGWASDPLSLDVTEVTDTILLTFDSTVQPQRQSHFFTAFRDPVLGIPCSRRHLAGEDKVWSFAIAAIFLIRVDSTLKSRPIALLDCAKSVKLTFLSFRIPCRTK
jgi:hypothetical protein